MDSSDLCSLNLLTDEPPSISAGAEAGLIIGLILLCVFSFFTTLCEVAYREASPTKLRYWYSKPQGRAALNLIKNKEMVIMCNRLLDVLCTIGIAVISMYLGLRTIPEIWLVILMACILAFLVSLVIGEVIPQAIATQRPERTALVMSYPMTAVFYVFYPLTFIFYGFGKIVKKIFHIQNKVEVSEKELKDLAMDAYKEGSIEKDEHDLVLNALNFDDNTLRKIMIPERNFTVVKKGMTLKEIEQIYVENNYSRLPVYDEENEKYVGILYQKDFYEMLITKNDTLEDIVKPALYMDASTNCAKALKRFQNLRQHMALVRENDEGDVIGLVTVEDLLEELVGRIDDEYDAEDLEKQKTQRLQERSDRAEAQDEKMRKMKFTDTVTLPSSDEDEETETNDESSEKD